MVGPQEKIGPCLRPNRLYSSGKICLIHFHCKLQCLIPNSFSIKLHSLDAVCSNEKATTNREACVRLFNKNEITANLFVRNTRISSWTKLNWNWRYSALSVPNLLNISQEILCHSITYFSAVLCYSCLLHISNCSVKHNKLSVYNGLSGPKLLFF